VYAGCPGRAKGVGGYGRPLYIATEIQGVYSNRDSRVACQVSVAASVETAGDVEISRVVREAGRRVFGRQ
jgi:hypothetical protein